MGFERLGMRMLSMLFGGCELGSIIWESGGYFENERLEISFRAMCGIPYRRK